VVRRREYLLLDDILPLARHLFEIDLPTGIVGMQGTEDGLTGGMTDFGMNRHAIRKLQHGVALTTLDW